MSARLSERVALNRAIRVGALWLLALPGATAFAEPLPEADLSPLIGTIGLARAEDSAWLPAAGEVNWRWTSSTASHSSQNADGSEMSLFDGETTRASLAAEWGVHERYSIGIEVPYLWHESGGLDGFVKRWHNWFGFPNNLRDLVADDRIDFRYADAGTLLLDNQQNQRGIGDIRLTAGWQWQRDATTAKALRIAVKLPTGDPRHLTGSGGTDIALGLVADYSALGGNPRWSSFYRAHAIFVGKPDRLQERARRFIGQASGGVSFRAWERLTLSAQATLRSQAYDSDLRLLGDPAMLLNVGGTIRLAERLRLAIAVGEDVRVDTAPDVTIALSLRYLPAAGTH